MDLVPNLLRQWLKEALHNRIVVNTKDGSVLVYVPEGVFEMGDDASPDSPKHQVYLSAYWIGIYCVTNAQYLRFTKETGHKLPPRNPAQKGLCAPFWDGDLYVGKNDHPVTCLGWADAEAYVHWAGCRLPTEAQWEKAARGPGGSLYPWGDTWDPSRCRCRQGYRQKLTTCRVHDYPEGVSGYGTYNQSGNVWEWCADWYAKDAYDDRPGNAQIQDPRGPDAGSARVIRGGSWWYDDPAYFRATYRHWNDPAYRRDSLGFRMVRPA